MALIVPARPSRTQDRISNSNKAIFTYNKAINNLLAKNCLLWCWYVLNSNTAQTKNEKSSNSVWNMYDNASYLNNLSVKSDASYFL